MALTTLEDLAGMLVEVSKNGRVLQKQPILFGEITDWVDLDPAKSFGFDSALYQYRLKPAPSTSYYCVWRRKSMTDGIHGVEVVYRDTPFDSALSSIEHPAEDIQFTHQFTVDGDGKTSVSLSEAVQTCVDHGYLVVDKKCIDDDCGLSEYAERAIVEAKNNTIT